MFNKQMILTLAACLLLASSLMADVAVPTVISSHMVLQRDMSVPIWGTANPGEKITVSFRDQQKTTTADKDGKWMVKLDKLDVGKPATMTIAATNTLTIEDVVVGEVWLASGQSNMAIGAKDFAAVDPVLAGYIAEPHPDIRFKNMYNGKWDVAIPKTIAGISALPFAFAVVLQKELGVPIGMIQAASGGSCSGIWVSEDQFNSDPACKALLAKLTADDTIQKRYTAALAKYQDDLAKWEAQVAELKAKAPGTQPAQVPSKPQPPVKVGQCRDGMGHGFQSLIQPLIPYAIRGVYWDQGESDTAVEGVDQFTLMGALISGWRKDWNQGEFPFLYTQKPSGRGCAYDYKNPLAAKADPFEKLPPSPPAGQASGSEKYIQMLQYPNTAMAFASDLGSGNHPENKSAYGARAARVALGFVYTYRIEYYGPIYASHKIESDHIRITFTHTGAGLAFANGEKLQGFAVAGDNKQFYWADAAIDGNDVVLKCPKVPHPVAIRYAWAWTTPWANLFNKDGLPALPFRTDSW